MLLQAFLVGLAAAIGQSDYLLGTAMVERPIVLGAIVGIFLGDIPTGVIVGFQLELAFMGVWQVGAAVPPNVIVGSVLGTAFAITMGAGPETALTIAMPTAVLAGMFDSLMYSVVTPPMAVWADRGAEKDDPKTIAAAMWTNGILYIIALGLICGVAFYVGNDAVQALIDAIPDWLTNGLTIATGYSARAWICAAYVNPVHQGAELPILWRLLAECLSKHSDDRYRGVFADPDWDSQYGSHFYACQCGGR